MKVLVTGANGQLGSEFRFLSSALQNERSKSNEFGEFADLDFVFLDKNALDLRDEKAVQKAVQRDDKGFYALINCAAYTAVDRAQSEHEEAFVINEIGAQNLAKVCKANGIKLVHISTDYVFNGKAHKPLVESDSTAPLGIYGESKLAGEKAILSANLAHSCIIRTSWLWSEFGSNFVKTIARLANERDEISVVSDQIGSPTNARDLAMMICKILPRLDTLKGTEIFHYANAGVASWFDFAYEIVRIVGLKCAVKSVSTDEYLAMNSGKIIAPRPFYSVLDTSKIKARFDIEIPHWRTSLAGANLANLTNSAKPTTITKKDSK